MAPKKKLNSVFLKQICDEPYRLFFPLGILIAILGVGHWPAYAFGWSTHYSAYFHSSLQTQSYLTCFVVGFLLTAMPRFASVPSATMGEVSIFLLWMIGNVAALCLGKWIAAEVCFVGILVSLLLFAKKRVGQKTKSVMPPLEFVWVPIAILHGLAGSVLMILIQLRQIPLGWVQPAKLFSEQGFILCIVIGVGGFLAPRLMGTFRVYSKPGQISEDSKLMALRRKVLAFHLISGVLFFVSFWIGLWNLNLSYWIRAGIITAQYLWTCSYLRFPRTPDLYARLLWVSLWMVVIGSWASAVFPQYRTAMLHVLFIGGLSLMIFAVATMVVLSHGGESEKLKRPLVILWITGLGMVLSLVFRVAAAFFPEQYFHSLGYAGAVWVTAGSAWFFYALPKTQKTMSAEELERAHAEAKERVAKLRQTKADRHSGECCHHESSCEAPLKPDPHSKS